MDSAFVGRGRSFRQCRASSKRREPGRGDPGWDGRLRGGKSSQDWSRIVEEFRLSLLSIHRLEASLRMSIPFRESGNDELLR
jgi:hypothetical protein